MTKQAFHPGTNKLGIILMNLRAEFRWELQTVTLNSQPHSATMDRSVTTDECVIPNPVAYRSSSNDPAPAAASATDTTNITAEIP